MYHLYSRNRHGVTYREHKDIQCDKVTKDQEKDYQSTMTMLSSPLYLFIIHLSFGMSLEVKAEDLGGFSHPPISRTDDQDSLIREKRAATDLPEDFETDIEISFPDFSMAAAIRSLLETSLNDLSLGKLTTISSVDVSPACNLSGSVAACSCRKEYQCLGTSGLCTDTECACTTTLPLQKYCKQMPNITVSPYPLFIGDTGRITCNFGAVVDVTWYHNSTKISDDSKYTTYSTKQGSTVLYQLKAKDLTGFDAGTYICSGSINGTIKNMSTFVHISKIIIHASPNIETFCDGSKLSISCCSPDIDVFNVTWQAEDAPGEESKNTTCKIYTLTADSKRCSSSQPIKYTCNFQRNEGARASNITTINYITKANIEIRAASQISAGKVLDITCITDVSVQRIQVAKDTTSNVKANKSNTNSVQFSIPSATKGWSGIFICTAYQSNLSSSQNITVNVVPLPRSEEIHVYPQQSYVKCRGVAVLTCCVFDENYTIQFGNITVSTPGTPSGDSGDMTCFKSEQLVECEPNAVSTVYCVVTNKLSDPVTSRDAMTISLLDGNTCKADNMRPETPNGQTYSVPCMTIDPFQLGNIIYLCKDGTWGEATNECFSKKIFSELQNLKNLVIGPDIEQNLPLFLENLKNVAKSESHNIANSPKNMKHMVEMISTIANQNITVSSTMMENYVQTVDIVVNTTSASNYSFTILKSMETFANHLQFIGSAISIKNENISNIQLFGQVVNSDTKYDANFSLAGLSGSVTIKNGTLPGESNTVVTIAYSSMKDLLQQQDSETVNALVMSTVISNLFSADIDKNVFDITMTFTKSDVSLKNPNCSWLDLDNQYWRSSGCETIDASDSVVKCSCNHLTSFSVLMGGTGNNNIFLALITYIGVAVSIVCLVITLVIEAVVWRSVIKNKTSYMRHVCLVNIAVTLLIADIWFIIGARLEEYPDSYGCITAAFFTCYFYLCLFFWMLVLGLILFYRLIYILHDISRRSMMIIAFTMGYGCPLLIAVIAVASTAPRGIFTDGEFCWLSEEKSRTYLAFVVPALTIVFINLIILIVVIVKLLRPAIGERPRHEERQNIVAIAKSIAVLTPLLGTSWALGLGVSLEPANEVIHGIFAAFNSLQGLFILISTVLLDQNVRKAVRSSISTSYWSTLRTKVQSSSTNSTASPKPPRKNIFRRTGGYHFNFPQDSSSGPSASSFSLLT